MYGGRVMACLGASLVFLPLPACGGGDRATPRPFAGLWSGHTRRLEISRDGRGREIVDDGCCSRVLTARFRLLHVRGTRASAVATMSYTFAGVDKDVFAELHRRPPINPPADIRSGEDFSDGSRHAARRPRSAPTTARAA